MSSSALDFLAADESTSKHVEKSEIIMLLLLIAGLIKLKRLSKEAMYWDFINKTRAPKHTPNEVC